MPRVQELIANPGMENSARAGQLPHSRRNDAAVEVRKGLFGVVAVPIGADLGGTGISEVRVGVTGTAGPSGSALYIDIAARGTANDP